MLSRRINRPPPNQVNIHFEGSNQLQISKFKRNIHIYSLIVYRKLTLPDMVQLIQRKFQNVSIWLQINPFNLKQYQSTYSADSKSGTFKKKHGEKN